MLTLPVKNINSKITENYNQITLEFSKNIAIQARAYNEGVAFRWLTSFNKSEIIINSEENTLNFCKDYAIYYPELNGKNFISHQEKKYHYFKNMSKTTGRLAKLEMPVPTLIYLDNNKKMLISESDLEAYPGWFVQKENTNATEFKSVFPKYPLAFRQSSFRTI